MWGEDLFRQRVWPRQGYDSPRERGPLGELPDGWDSHIGYRWSTMTPRKRAGAAQRSLMKEFGSYPKSGGQSFKRL